MVTDGKQIEAGLDTKLMLSDDDLALSDSNEPNQRQLIL